MLNLMTEPILEHTGAEGERKKATLPQTYQALMLGQVKTFPHLRPHQQHAWHAFLTQLAVLAVRKAGAEEPPTGAGEWSGMLQNLTDGALEPWELVVPDRTKPAFMQPPTDEPDDPKKPGVLQRTPDSLDYLATSKNFEEKKSIIWDATPSDWLFALVSLQTMAQYMGSGTYNTSRMNGGSASRPALSLFPPGGHGERLRRDITALLGRTSPAWDTRPALLWTLRWDGKKDEIIPLRELHPLYIDVSRRVRLTVGPEGRIEARKLTSMTPRSGSKNDGGITGDPWAPASISSKGAKLLTIDREGFGQSRVARIAFESAKWQTPLLMEPLPGEVNQPGSVLSARAAAGGQAETNAFHHLEIPFSPSMARAMRNPEEAEQAVAAVKLRGDHIHHVYECLCEALALYIARGNPESVNQQNRKTAAERLKPHADSPRRGSIFHRMMDADFLEDLQQELDAPPEERQSVHAAWLLQEDGVIERARATLHSMTPTPVGGNPAPATAARNLFDSLLTKRVFPDWVIEAIAMDIATATEQAAQAENPAKASTRRDYGPAAQQAPDLANAIANLALRKPYILGELQRMNPEKPESETFFDLTRHLWENEPEETRTGWAIIAQGMAMMTQVHQENTRRNGAHRNGRTLGKALFLGNERRPLRDFIVQPRVNRLMQMRGKIFRTELSNTFRQLAQSGAKLDWKDAARFVLENGKTEVRQQVYQDYLNAKYQPSQG